MKLTHFSRDSWNAIYSHIEIIYNILRESEEENLLDNVQLFNEINQTETTEKITTGQEQTIYRGIQAFLVI